MRANVLSRKIFTFFGFLLILLSLMKLESCKRDSIDSDTDPKTVTPVSRYEMVTIDLGTTNLTQNVYSGRLGNSDIQLQKVDSGKLIFMVPANQNLGENLLKISSLEKSFKYNVKDVTLNDTAENTIIPFKNNIETYSQSLDTSAESLALKNSFSKFNTIFANSSNEEKQNIAKFYATNKVLIDDIILNDFSNINRGINEITYYDRKFYGAVLLMGAGVATCILSMQAFYTSPNIFGPMAILGGLVAIVSLDKAKKFGKLTMENNLTVLDNFDIDGYSGTNRNALGNLSLNSGVVKVSNFNTKYRAFIANDRTITSTRTQNFFVAYDKFNKAITDLNKPIADINTKYPTLKIPTFPLFAIATTNPLTNVALNSALFSKFTFSINNPNVSLDNVSYNTEGKINIKASIKSNSTGDSYNADLLYAYKDDFKSFTGKMPITVSKASLIVGTWKHISTYWCGICESCIPELQQVSASCGTIIGSPACAWQMQLNFSSNNTGFLADQCGPNENFTYSLNNNSSTLLINGLEVGAQGFEILELTATTLKIKDLNIPNDNRISTFQRQ